MVWGEDARQQSGTSPSLPGGARCPCARALCGLRDARGCGFACGMLGRASLPPLHGQTSLIAVTAEAAGRLQEVQHPSP